MRRLSRRGGWVISLGFVIVIFYVEVISYIVNTKYWERNEVWGQKEEGGGNEDLSSKSSSPLRVLLVADPQILGENNELPFLGLFTRWDSDRFLQKNFMLAQFHVQPHVVGFLGDLFDEGSVATDPEFRRYTKRFRDIFQIPRKQDPSPIQYAYLPGDNDVGGEGREAVDPVKLKWFNQTFGDFKKELTVEKGGVKVQFLKMNMFIPEEYQDPTKGREHLLNTRQEEYRILLSHTSLLSFKTRAVQTILDQMQPHIIFSAHSHLSAYAQLEDNEVVKSSSKFLMSHKHSSRQHWLVRKVSSYLPPFENERDTAFQGHKNYDLQTSAKITLALDSTSRIVHEIAVPTCSYRMGVPHTGFGAFNLYKNGTLEYTVLWLPSRFNQLYLYLAVYLVLKISLISFLSFKCLTFCCRKMGSLFDLTYLRVQSNNNNGSKGSAKYHAV